LQLPYTTLKEPDDQPFFIVEAIGEKHSAFVLDRETREILFMGDEAAALGRLASLP
jgi:hypothetical protein